MTEKGASLTCPSLQAVTHGKIIDVKWLILAQMVVFLPLSLIRSLAKLSGTALIADAFILIGRESAPFWSDPYPPFLTGSAFVSHLYRF